MFGFGSDRKLYQVHQPSCIEKKIALIAFWALLGGEFHKAAPRLTVA
jgi:hypothetical protein